MQSNYCYEIKQSLQGYILVSGDQGLTFLDPEEKLIKVINLESAMPISGINLGCGILVCKNGEIFVGGIDGMTSFFEQDLFYAPKEYTLYFSDLYINNEEVLPDDQHKILSEALPYTNKLELAHNQNNLILSFTTNSYLSMPAKANYEYMLEGFERRWIETKHTDISYTNLNPGRYKLIVRERIYNPNQQPKTISMNIHIRSPWYASNLAYFLYILLIIIILYGFLRFKQSQLLLKTSLEIERKEKEQIEELNHAKLQFFSNISHEFRTPLTLIISQMEVLLQSHTLAPSIYNKLLKINKNTYHMRNLISELLDFRKLEQGHVKLKVYEQDIIPFLKEIYYSFHDYASSRQINYGFTSPENPVLCWMDPKQMQKVFYNLLSNSFKYTKPNASIEIVVEEQVDSILIKVIDNGSGIQKKDIDKIFDRFYQADNEPTGSLKAPSTGIGLSLCKNIVELHHGEIQVESTPDYGSIFIVSLKKGKSHFNEEICNITPEQIVMEHDQETILSLKNYIAELPEEFIPEDIQERDYTILLVEDNEELLQLLNNLFSPVYKTILARNGKEGLQKAREIQPDLIISDVMMPEMSGTEMCFRIKKDFELCHIPVILLTALTSTEQNVEGYQRGADAYLNKPFNSKVLIARCSNLIRNRIILQKKFGGHSQEDSQTTHISPMDQKFIEQIQFIIEQNIDNPDFDMHQLARELALSRSSLYAKFKSLTGMPPNEFVLNYKLSKAAEMLKDEPGLQIIEISERLGFGSPRYFTRCFKAHYSKTPAEYRKGTIKEP